jgi:hypothetical protein
MRATNDIPLGCPLLTVTTLNSVQTLKADASQVTEWVGGIQLVIDQLCAIGGVVDSVSAKVNQTVASPLSSGRMQKFGSKISKAQARMSQIGSPSLDTFTHVASVAADDIAVEELPDVVTPPPAASDASAFSSPDNDADGAAADAGADDAPVAPLEPAFPIPCWIPAR